ncbi:hypothetical protein AU194_20235 [Mycobacterium sp. GA-2829]|nr:hypothetical protein AU194_20235 [Mycobacterium sp. GA-2829]
MADERLGLIIKVSHALTDGVGGITSLLPQLMTTDPREGFSLVAVDAPSTGLPSDRQVIGDLLHEITENTLAGIKLVAKVAPRLARSAVTGVAGALTNPTRRSRNSDEDDTAREPASGVPRTILNEPLTDRRSVAMGTVALSDMRKIAEHFETTVNDVYLACLSSALREWHRCHDRIPDGPLVGFMPISTRTEGDDSPNSWTVALIKLPMQGSDTTQRLQAITSTTRRLKKSRRSASPVNAADVTQLIPPLVARTAATVYVDCELGRLHAPLFHTLASNVPGPAADIYVAGALVERMHACAPLFAGANLSIVAVSHGDRFDLGITACPDNVPAVDEIATSFEEAVGELLAKV